MLECVLWMWLASDPNRLANAGQFNTNAECRVAMLREVNANLRAGRGGGVTYFCGDLIKGACKS